MELCSRFKRSNFKEENSNEKLLWICIFSVYSYKHLSIHNIIEQAVYCFTPHLLLSNTQSVHQCGIKLG